ncbi:hypothetical protein MTR_2g019040 [Medicago truncatula]|uniref:Nucleic acid-binding protein n=1 Tax=Medicago truncatula TaxID=3880 RepID=G7IP57_MEDTR|nr:hypothetical protein MTR_2g019040 [Medicago truncatula]
MFWETEKDGRKSRVIDPTLEDLENNRLHCSLWGEHADKIVTFFGNHDNDTPTILILQFCKTRMYVGAMGVANAFNGTKLILNGDLPDVAVYMTRSPEVSAKFQRTALRLYQMTCSTLTESIESMIESTELYVAISRVTSRGGLKILINDDDGDDTDVASSVIYREVFRNKQNGSKKGRKFGYVHTNLRLLSRKEDGYKKGQSRMCEPLDDVGIELAELSLDEPDLEVDLYLDDGNGGEEM